jgi:hypothetical protein
VAHHAHAFNERARPGEDRAERGVEVLVEGDVHRVEERGILGRRHAAVGGGEEHPRAVQVRADLLLARVRAHLLHLVEEVR